MSEQTKGAVGHTPGPWVVERIEHEALTVLGALGYRGDDEDRRVICDIPLVMPVADEMHGDGYADEENATTEADARLIAAAPELLGALRTARRAMTNRRYGKPKRDMEDAYAAVDAAIAKAEGES